MKNRQSIRRGLGVVCASLMLLVPAGVQLVAQENPDQQAAPSEQPLLSPDQLNTLVAPVALYPDKLLSQVLVASTYPLEIVELGQWLQQNGSLQGAQRVDAARQQNWDPSIQALVAFPDVVSRLNSDIRWTTDLGNAFLAQEADVMNAVQRLRAQANAAGKLNSTPQQSVTTETQGGETVYDIQPTDPQVVYVPVYNPQYIWGPPAYGYYPPLYYPNYGFGFGSGIYIGGFFGGLGWGGWGWGPNWFGGVVITNGYFFNHYGFHNYYGGGFRGGVWAHNSEHRLGVAYPNRGLANRFGGQSGRVNNGGNFGNRGNSGVGQNYRSQEGARSFGSQGNRMNGSANRQTEQRSFSSNGRNSFSTPESRGGGNQNYRSSPSFNSGGASGFRSAPSNGGASNNSGFRSAPSYRSSPPAGGGNSFRSAPSSGGGSFRSAPPSGGGNFHSNGGSVRGSGGGGGGSHGGGGGSHGGHR